MTLPRISYPQFDVEIPSTKQTIKMRPMLVREEKILLMAKEGNDPGEILSAIKNVVGSCLVSAADPGEITPKVDDLAIFDLEFLFLRLRAQSVSDKAEVAYIDNDEVNTSLEAVIADMTPEQKAREEKYGAELAKAQAKATYTFQVDLNKVEVKFPENSEKNIKVNDTVGIILRYPPASLYGNPEFMNARGEDIVDMLIENSVETVYDSKVTTAKPSVGPGKIPNLKDWVNNLDVKTYNKIKTFFTDLPHLFYEIKYTNKNGKDRTITLTTLNDFFTFV